MKTIALAILLALGAAPVQDMPQPSPRLEQHEWLQQLVGEWEFENPMGSGTESIRSIGGLWVVAEASASSEGRSLTSLMTLGYDPRAKTFVGTWIDTFYAHLWHYEGSLDDAKKVLTLSADGPDFADPTKTAKYRDAIELKGPDHKVLTASLQNADGTWTTFMTTEYRRKKS